MIFSLRILILPFTVLFFAFPLALASTEQLTLQQAIEAAKAANPDLQRARAAANEASWRKLEALSGHIPQLGVNAWRILNAEYLSIPFGTQTVQIPTPPTTSLTLNASWTLFDGLQTIRNYQAADLSAKASGLDLARVELQTENQTKLRFYQALAAQLLDDVAVQNVRTLQDHLKRANDLLAEGQATKFDILRVKVQLAEAYPDKTAADDNVVITRSALAQTMGLSEDHTPLSGILPEPREGIVPPDLRFEPEKRQDLQAQLNRAEAFDKAHLASYSTLMPRLAVSYQYQFYNFLDHDSIFSIHYDNAYLLMLSLTWNLFDGGASIARQRETFYQQQQAEAAATSLQLRAPNEVDTWKRRYNYNVQLYHARKESITTAEESVRLAKIGYEAGTRTGTDVLDSELDLFRARAGAVRAQSDATEALINLELALGRKF